MIKKVKHRRKSASNRRIVIHIDRDNRVSKCSGCGSYVYKYRTKQPTQYRYFNDEVSAMRYIHRKQDEWSVKGYTLSSPRRVTNGKS